MAITLLGSQFSVGSTKN